MIPAPTPTKVSEKLLEVRNLSVGFPAPDGSRIRAVNSLSFDIRKMETVALVGESGCGKSVTAFSIMRLLQKPGEITGGELLFEGQNLLDLDEESMRKLRGSAISMIFQEPMTSLNPVLKIGFQIAEAISSHKIIPKQIAVAEAVKLLKLVGIPSAEERYDSYPHQLSGGMKQRAMIAMALACAPRLLIADEPTTALDVTIQAQILELIDRLKREIGMSLLLITHNLGIVAERADRTVIMYSGCAVESGKTRMIMENPLHPYTRGLLASLPQRSKPGEKIPTISGTIRPLGTSDTGCPLAGRCICKLDECTTSSPPMVEIEPGHQVACWKAFNR
jgi:peptide/nickel transport system ATP-binding protein